MRGAGRGLFIAAAAAAAAAWLLAADLYPRRNPHAHFQNPSNCPRCHVMAAGRPDPERFLPESNAFCTGCHQESELGRSHPIRVRPRDRYWKMKVPEEFRLDDEGKMMCLTCHSAHGAFLSTIKAFPAQKPEPWSGGGAGVYYRTLYLRRSDPKLGFASLCDACHGYL